jgi:hypothetical protein
MLVGTGDEACACPAFLSGVASDPDSPATNSRTAISTTTAKRPMRGLRRLDTGSVSAWRAWVVRICSPLDHPASVRQRPWCQTPTKRRSDGAAPGRSARVPGGTSPGCQLVLDRGLRDGRIEFGEHTASWIETGVIGSSLAGSTCRTAGQTHLGGAAPSIHRLRRGRGVGLRPADAPSAHTVADPVVSESTPASSTPESEIPAYGMQVLIPTMIRRSDEATHAWSIVCLPLADTTIGAVGAGQTSPVAACSRRAGPSRAPRAAPPRATGRRAAVAMTGSAQPST